MGGHRAGLPRRASGEHLDRVAGQRSGAALGAADRHTGGADGVYAVCPCRNWIEQGFRGLKTVGCPLGGKWHKTRRLNPTRVGRHWLVLAIATLLAVAYGTRHEEAEARHREPGRLRRPPAELTPAQRAALPPRRHSLLQQGVALLRHLLLRGYLWACVWLRPTPGPDFSTRLRQVDPGGT